MRACILAWVDETSEVALDAAQQMQNMQDMGFFLESSTCEYE